MKVILIIIFLFSFHKIIAQDIEKIKKANTIYIYFKEEKKPNSSYNNHKK